MTTLKSIPKRQQLIVKEKGFKVTEKELEILKKAEPNIKFTVFIACFPFAISTLVTLLISVVNQSILILLVCMISISFTIAIINLIHWRKRKNEIHSLISEIKKRKFV